MPLTTKDLLTSTGFTLFFTALLAAARGKEVSGPLTMSGETVNVTAPATVRYLPASDETAAAGLERSRYP